MVRFSFVRRITDYNNNRGNFKVTGHMLLLILMFMLVIFCITLKTGAKSPVILTFWTLFSRYHCSVCITNNTPLQRKGKEGVN